MPLTRKATRLSSGRRFLAGRVSDLVARPAAATAQVECRGLGESALSLPRVAACPMFTCPTQLFGLLATAITYIHAKLEEIMMSHPAVSVVAVIGIFHDD